MGPFCKCGHDDDDHATSGCRPRRPCEHPDCDCADFEPLKDTDPQRLARAMVTSFHKSKVAIFQAASDRFGMPHRTAATDAEAAELEGYALAAVYVGLLMLSGASHFGLEKANAMMFEVADVFERHGIAAGVLLRSQTNELGGHRANDDSN